VKSGDSWWFVFLVAWVSLLLIAPVWVVGEVDPAEITPLANTMGGLLAVPIARLFAALLLVLGCVALAHQRAGLGLLLIVLSGCVLVGPAFVRIVIGRAAAGFFAG
jgi:hypothetical protein